MADTLKVNDVVDGAEGSCYAVINGEQVLLAYVKNIEATVEKNKSDIRVLGSTATKHRAVGWNGTGSMTMYYVSSRFREMMFDYMKTGKDVYFDIIIENKNINSETMDRQTVVLHQVNIDKVSIAKLDIDSTELDEDIDFTFNGAELLNSFKELVWE